MPENTFDIVSKIDLAEVSNAVQQALKEIHQRFDLKDSKSDIQLNEKDNKLVLASLDDYKLKAVSDVLQQKLVKRKRIAERPDVRPDYASRWVHRSPGNYAPARHRD